MNKDTFESRKKDHIRCSLQEESQSLAMNDWERISLVPEALPELDFEEVTLSIESLGRQWSSPFFVSSMTAGHSESLNINSTLAGACEETGWLLGVGSQRRELEDLEAHQEWVKIRKKYPKVNLASNIGLSQLITTPIDRIRKLIEVTNSIGLFVHLNPLQECLQMEGTPQFKGGLKALETLVRNLEVPVIVKEVGVGISVATVKRLNDVGVAAVDVSGRGGTHWGRVEGLRAPIDSPQAMAAQTFKDWGLSTPKALYGLQELPKLELEVWASGGVRDGLQGAKCLALGARRVGLARPILAKAMVGAKSVVDSMRHFEYELKISLFCLGMKNISEMKQRKVWVWERE